MEGATVMQPKEPVHARPEDLIVDDKFMKGLDARGWYVEIATRLRSEYLAAECSPEAWANLPPGTYGPWRPEPGMPVGFVPITDPCEMDRMMCRDKPIVEVVTELDLKVAQYNGRMVVEIDLDCPNKLRTQQINELIETARTNQARKQRRHFRLEALADHKIITLLNFRLAGYDLSRNQKQLDWWIFPEIKDPKKRNDKYNRARELLNEAITVFPILRFWKAD